MIVTKGKEEGKERKNIYLKREKKKVQIFENKEEAIKKI